MTALLAGDWRDDAACSGIDPEVFFPVSAGLGQVAAVNRAKAICRECPVKAPCLADTLAMSPAKRNVNQIRGGRYFAQPSNWKRKEADS